MCVFIEHNLSTTVQLSFHFKRVFAASLACVLVWYSHKEAQPVYWFTFA